MYRLPERRQDSAGFEEEQFCSDERGKLDTRNVPITEYVYSDQHLREEIPGVAVCLSKRKYRYERRNGVQNQLGGLGSERGRIFCFLLELSS